MISPCAQYLVPILLMIITALHLPVPEGLHEGILLVTSKKDYMPLDRIEWTASSKEEAKPNKKMIGWKKTIYCV